MMTDANVIATAMPDEKRSIYMAADGFGEDLKNELKRHLEDKHPDEFTVVDLGTDTYFDAAAKVGRQIGRHHTQKNDGSSSTSGAGHYGLLVCGTGMGVGMVANQFPGVRVATVETVSAARCARAVNDANVICVGQLVTPPDHAKRLVDAFLGQAFNTRPVDENGRPMEWWNENVEAFLSTSHEGLSRVEEEARNF
jgi:ribose 5-phosphate isomerase B